MKKLRLPLCLFVTVLASVVLLWKIYPSSRVVFSPQEDRRPLVVIDAGHGGADGGAVAADGSVHESQLNLEITRRLALLLLFCGEQVALTRSDEGDLASPEAETIREKKVSDLHRRVEAIEKAGADALISIHQNSLPLHPEVHGAQVFYNHASSAVQLAQSVQTILNHSVNPGNEKQCKAIDNSIFLMEKVSCPAILVECGFLSNREETKLLCTDHHQIELTLAIAAGYLRFTSERGIL